MARFLQNSLLQPRWSREETLKQLCIVKEIASMMWRAIGARNKERGIENSRKEYLKCKLLNACLSNLHLNIFSFFVEAAL